VEIPATRNTGILTGNVQQISTISSSNHRFERCYNHLRRKEERVFTDAETALLPEVPRGHPHSGEWKIRSASCKKLVSRLRKKKRELSILEVGCGNGWLSHQLAMIMEAQVVGLDINAAELEQAKRVFAGCPNLQFLYGALNSFGVERFDVIVFASSIQYFPSLTGTLQWSLQLLHPGGEIHILDSHFYSKEESKAAQKRSQDYFHRMKMEEMNDFYFHHSLASLRGFSYEVLYQPRSFTKRIFPNANPFYWVCINAPK